MEGTEKYLIEWIEEGIRKGWDVSWLVKEEWVYERVWHIRWGLEDGLDVSIYAKKEFSNLQMDQIRKGLRDGLDVSVYAKKEIDWREMKVQVKGGEAQFMGAEFFISSVYHPSELWTDLSGTDSNRQLCRRVTELWECKETGGVFSQKLLGTGLVPRPIAF